MKLRIDYINKLQQPRHIFVDAKGKTDDYENLGFILVRIVRQGATDIRIVKL